MEGKDGQRTNPTRLTKTAFLTHVRIAARLAVEHALTNAADRFASGTSAGLQRIGDHFASLEARMDVLRENDANRQDELNRLREGYDWAILKRFALRLIHTVDSLSARVADRGGETQVGQELEVVRLELTFLLESHDIVEWAPELGQPALDIMSRCEVLETRPPSPAGQQGRVLEVLRRGFVYAPIEGMSRVIRPAQIAIAQEE